MPHAKEIGRVKGDDGSIQLNIPYQRGWRKVQRLTACAFSVAHWNLSLSIYLKMIPDDLLTHTVCVVIFASLYNIQQVKPDIIYVQFRILDLRMDPLSPLKINKQITST